MIVCDDLYRNYIHLSKTPSRNSPTPRHASLLYPDHITRSNQSHKLHTYIQTNKKFIKHATYNSSIQRKTPPFKRKKNIKTPSAMHARSPHHISTPPRRPLLPRVTRTSHIQDLAFAHPSIVSPTRISRWRALVCQRATLVVWIEVSLGSRACGSWSALAL